jgi:hypothetical protein
MIVPKLGLVALAVDEFNQFKAGHDVDMPCQV